MNTIQRYPRPKGLTQLSANYKKDSTKTNKARFNKAIITYYLSNQIMYIYPMAFSKLNPYKDTSPDKATSPTTKNRKKNNKLKDPTKANPTHNHHQYQIRIIEYNELCIMFGFSHSKVQRLLNKYLAKQGKSYLDTQVMNDMLGTTRATLFGLIGKSLNRLQAQEGWQEELKAISRDYGYKASMVKEANSAITGTQQMLDQIFRFGTGIMKGFEPNNPQAPSYQQNNYYGDNPQGNEPLDEKGYLLTTTKAIQLMEEKGLLTMPTEEEHLALHAQYITPDIPSTQALPSDAQGIQKKEMVLVKDTELTHTDRREEGLDSLNPIDVDPIDDDYVIVE